MDVLRTTARVMLQKVPRAVAPRQRPELSFPLIALHAFEEVHVPKRVIVLVPAGTRVKEVAFGSGFTSRTSGDL